MRNTFTHKGYGRIYVLDPNRIEEVVQVLTEIDPYETKGYLPEKLIAPFSSYPEVTYTQKFSDMSIDEITAKCLSKGICVWCYDAGHNEYPTNFIEEGGKGY